MQLERSRVSPGVCSQVKLPLFPAAVRNVSLQQGIVMDRGTFWLGGDLNVTFVREKKVKCIMVHVQMRGPLAAPRCTAAEAFTVFLVL